MNTIDPRYLAGVIDSDGSFTIAKRHVVRKTPNFTIMVQLNWKKSDLTKSFMEELRNQYGGSFCECKSTNKKTSIKTSDYFSYCATGKAAEKIILDVFGHLKLKKQQALNLLDVRNLMSIRREVPEEAEDQLEHLYKINKKLNTKNNRLQK